MNEFSHGKAVLFYQDEFDKKPIEKIFSKKMELLIQLNKIILNPQQQQEKIITFSPIFWEFVPNI